MCRRSTKAESLALLAKLRDRLPGLVLRTSLICGLPGEGEAEFEELCHFLREQRIQRAGVFQFSPEEGTLAAAMEGQVDPDTAARRVELVVDLQSRVMDEYNETGVDLYTTHRAAIESLTPAKIVAFLKKVVASNNHIQVVMLPEL